MSDATRQKITALKTTESRKADFIEKANRIHNNFYDYSEVDYINARTKVVIICPLHGSFEQMPFNHLKGQNCPECKRLERSLSVNDFIDRARIVHDNKYDYSRVKYVNTKTKVEIICPEHGLFMMTPEKHMSGHGCPGCNEKKLQEQIESTNMQKYGVKYPLQSGAIRAKMRQTCLERYGVDNPAKLSSVKEKMKKTSLEKYGTEWAVQSETSREKRENTNKIRYGGSSPFSAESVREKTEKSIQQRYGVDNPAKSEVIKNKIKQTNLQKYGVEQVLSSPEVIAKKEKTMIERYGGKGAMCSADVREKSRRTNIAKYGFGNPAQNRDIYEKILKTKSFRHSFAKSDSEDLFYGLLCEKFGANDVERQYALAEYPYPCDFYIRSLNLYIELNASWTHGRHWYGSYDEDASVLREWSEKQTEYYDNAIQTWSQRDVDKYKTAEKNKLNYLVFWDCKLRDAGVWFAMGCPIGKDYGVMYSWLPKRALNDVARQRNTLSAIVKSYQTAVFYGREIAMWNRNDLYSDISLQMYIYANRLKYLGKTPDQLTDLQILNAFRISGILKGYTEFDTALMDQVIQKYNIRSVYDPCAGWGERMLYCYLHDIDYFGIDVNSELKPGYDKMIADYDMTRQNIIFSDSSLVKPVVRDAVLTCPPYGSIEKYSPDGAENLSEGEFLEWWDRLVKQCLDFEYFCFQINQRYKRSMQVILEQNDFVLIDELTYKNNKSSHFTRKQGENLKREFETMLVFKNNRRGAII